MKTTIEIADSLLEEARRVTIEEGTTLRALVEEGLRTSILGRRTRRPFRLQDASFRGHGLQAGFADASWSEIRAAAYEGRGT